MPTRIDGIRKTRTEYPSVSTVVLTYNSEDTIEKCLDSLLQLDYPHEQLEIIVIDNGSTDATLQILDAYGLTHHIRPSATISQMRNYGIEQARGKVIGFVDSDCQIEPDWIRNALAHLANPEIGIVGCNYDVPEDSHWIEQAWSTASEQIVKQVNFVPAGNMVIRKEVFEEVSGFSEGLETGEDTDLCARVKENGYKIISDPGVRSIHWGNPKTAIDFVKKEIWYGKGMVRLLRERNFLNKVLLLTNGFIFMHVALLTALLLPVASVIKIPIAIALALLVLFMVVLSALYRCRQLNVYTFFPQLVVLWYLYFVGRAISLIRIYSSFLLKRDRAVTSER